ncbi:hypothetical protein [Ornithinimicrobium cerasi]|uniref:hypothetical protein n=1 Tax=Ornithinimicrobium cerasi TaxID=2248773 RepID=UPI00137B6882|nr:hypothetical protein [Ornithinimicrobium cerasi]
MSMVKNARGRDMLNFANPLGSDPEKSAGSYILDAATQLVGERLAGLPNTGSPAVWERPDLQNLDSTTLYSQMRINKVESNTDDRKVSIVLDYGFIGEFPRAVGDSEIDLKGSAPSGRFRALLLMPADGTKARAVVETHGTRCPVNILMKWLSWTMYEEATAPSKPNDWINLKAYQLGDAQRLSELISKADKVEIELTEHHPTKPGARVPVLRKMTQNVTTNAVKTRLGKMASKFLEDNYDRQGYVAKLTKIAGLDVDQLADAGAHFDAGGIRVTEKNGDSRLLTPDNARDVFTYDRTDLQRSDEDWLKTALNRLKGHLSEGTDIFDGLTD